MKITGKITVETPRQRVFEALRNAEFFASCVDGVREMNEIDDTHYTAILETKVAYISFKFDVAVEITRIEEPNLIEAQVSGTPMGIVGRLTSSAITELHEDGDNTIIEYTIDVNLTGKLGSLGQPVLKSKAREMERIFTKRMREAFAKEDAMVEGV